MTVEGSHGKAKADDATKEPLAGDDTSGEVADEDLDGVAGGGSGDGTCPKCGSGRVFYEPSNHCLMCADCDYMIL